MTKFTYKIITPNREILEGEATGLMEFFVRRTLQRDNNTVIFIQRQKNIVGSFFGQMNIVSMSIVQKILFFRNLAMMLDSGVPLSNALFSSMSQSNGLGMRKVVQNIYDEVNNGERLSKSMSKYQSLFPIHIIKTIELGEQSGTLPQTLDRISVDLERSYELRRKVVGAVTYPAIILFFMLAAAILLIVMVIPQIATLFADLDAELPRSTQALQSFGIFLTSYPLQIIGTLLASIVIFIMAMKFSDFRYLVHSLILRIPVIGPLLREYTLSVFTRSLGTLLASGITFVQALETVKGIIRNESYIRAVGQLYPVVLQGGSLSDAIKGHAFHFPEQLHNLVEVGEQTGKLRLSFEKASEHYERSVIFQTQMLTTVIEPALMIAAGILVGFLAFSMFGPLYGAATIM